MIKDQATATLAVMPLVEVDSDEFSGFDPTGAISSTPTPVGTFHINLIANASISSAPAGFMQTMQDAARIIESLLRQHHTEHHGRLGRGEGTAVTRSHIALGGGNGWYRIYAKTLAALTSNRTTTDDSAAVASLPGSLNPNGNGSVAIYVAQETALGFRAASDATIDG